MSRTRLPSVPFALRALPVLAGIALLTAAAPRAQAQQLDRDSQVVTIEAPRPATPAAVTPAPVAPSMSATPAAVTRSAVGSEADPATAFRVAQAREAGAVVVAQGGNQQKGKVYMIVGGAALITGAIVGDDAGGIIMIGGALLGLWGLYQYLK